ncbi:MAG: hypothetical protein F4Y71_07900 [Acidobacteria bacterium]|nr:hypothetical protein [Acidobacteriota bacterium]MXW71800.1 hypothetical protein [Acidobacteriota bacterium]MXX86363.1 hypothetical protein [Acidobacteriota bacterium]MYE43294.1 hypothetical protein [Acidobacteriota bacterium]MYF77601.1 hypothetical protein [Acidobacteriota bacterium]
MRNNPTANPSRLGVNRTPLAALSTAILVVLLSVGLVACGESPMVPEAHGPESGSESGTESGSESSSGSGEPGESGTQYGLADTAHETRSGVDLVMSYDAAAQAFTGTVTNTTAAAISNVRVEIHLSNGVELGPTARVTLNAGQTNPVQLAASGQSFTRWSVHVELGSGAN